MSFLDVELILILLVENNIMVMINSTITFLDIFLSSKNKKVRQPKSTHRKAQTPIVAKQTLIDRDINPNNTIKRNLRFHQIQE